MESNCCLNLTLFFWYSNKKYFQFNFSKFQGAIWKLFTQEFQDRSYFLEYMVLRITKLSLNLSTYRWNTLYKDKRKTEKKPYLLSLQMLIVEWQEWRNIKSLLYHIVQSNREKLYLFEFSLLFLKWYTSWVHLWPRSSRQRYLEPHL